MKKKVLIITLAVIVLIAAVIAVIFTNNQKEDDNFDNMVEKFESAAKEVLGEDLKTTYYEGGDPSSVTGLNTEALNVLFPTEYMDSCEEMMIQNWHGALYKKDDKAYLCWTYDPEVSYVLEYNPNTIDDSEIIKMAESAEPVE